MSDDGGPAFPSRRDLPFPTGGSYRDDRPGMSLREWFAGMALQGLLACDANSALEMEDGDTIDGAIARWKLKQAHWCVGMAEAMLAAIARKETI